MERTAGYDRFYQALEIYEASTGSEAELRTLKTRFNKELRQRFLSDDELRQGIIPHEDLLDLLRPLITLQHVEQADDRWTVPELGEVAASLFNSLLDNVPLDSWAHGDPEGDRIAAGRPDPLPSITMLEKLTQLRLPDTSYQPDGDEDLSKLAIAIHVKASVLLTTLLLSGYSDDIEPTHSELANLIDRHPHAFKDCPLPLSLSSRVSAELAYQRGEYVEALSKAAESVSCLHNIYLHPPVTAPWLSKVMRLVDACIEAIEQHDARAVDWSTVYDAYYKLSMCPDDDDDRDLWVMKMGWVEAQLTPDQFRSLIKDREDESAEKRLEKYFFADGLWGKLPQRARDALVSADRMVVSATHGRHASIANEIRIATEEVLHQYLWLPISQWAEGQGSPQRGLQTILEEPSDRGRSPGIGDSFGAKAPRITSMTKVSPMMMCASSPTKNALRVISKTFGAHAIRRSMSRVQPSLPPPSATSTLRR